jgi:ribonuclease R
VAHANQLRRALITGTGQLACWGSAVPGLARCTLRRVNDPRKRLDELVDRLGIRPSADPQVDAEVAAWIASPGLDDGLVDETAVPYVTIDNEDSRDLDQALHVTREGDSFTLRYALADASYYARPGTALWRRALAMGSSYYLPGFAIPMLPEALSEGIVSLNPAVLRRAVVFTLRVDAEGRCVEARVHRARIFSRAKLSYEGVQRWFDAGCTGDPRCDAPEVSESLLAFAALGTLRIAEAATRGVLPLQRYEAEVDLDPNDPRRLMAVARDRNDVERWNEQISLLCNMEGAKMLQSLGHSDDDVQAVYRVHLPPLDVRLAELEEILRALAERRGLEDRWRWRRGRHDLAAWMGGLPGGELTARLSQAVQRQVRYTYRASEFQARSGPHHALGVDGYSRMSAPMREAVGVFSHKELLEGLKLVAPRSREEDLVTREAVIATANEARRRQGEIDNAVDLLVLEQLLGDDLAMEPARRPWRSGTVVGVRPSRVYVALDECAVDLKVYVVDLESIYGTAYREDHRVALLPEATDRGAPTFVMGDPVEAQAERWESGAVEVRDPPAARAGEGLMGAMESMRRLNVSWCLVLGALSCAARPPVGPAAATSRSTGESPSGGAAGLRRGGPLGAAPQGGAAGDAGRRAHPGGGLAGAGARRRAGDGGGLQRLPVPLLRPRGPNPRRPLGALRRRHPLRLEEQPAPLPRPRPPGARRPRWWSTPRPARRPSGASTTPSSRTAAASATRASRPPPSRSA